MLYRMCFTKPTQLLVGKIFYVLVKLIIHDFFKNLWHLRQDAYRSIICFITRIQFFKNWCYVRKLSRSLLFVKDSWIQFVGLGLQNLLSFRILIGIPPADALSEGKFFKTILTVASETCWKENLWLSWNFSLILRILGWFEKLSMIPWTFSSLALTFEDQLN